MTISTVFINNGTQAVRLPADVRLPEKLKKVRVRALGKERIISPVDQSWDSFFQGGTQVSEDFMAAHRMGGAQRYPSDFSYADGAILE